MVKKIVIALAGLLVAGVISRYYFVKKEVWVGDDAEDISFIDRRNQSRNLYEFGGKYVILSFWGSWCGPCRTSNQKLVEFYSQQDTARLKIISVGIEKTTSAWNTAIREDSLYWDEQFTPLDMFNNEIAKSYGVNETPTYFLINPAQVVISKSGNIDAIIQKFQAMN
ncbi:TlpA family protein disulfide reductase [Membranicola marinus]|uniref:TlpA family protein disulfide reductase n=1 Tax=Membranihabitans marinus TaxID=1227546 RepID=A0A953LB15_9BACT|nr:TlpA disulfide reductase family protein [Membranihabitans marinus]MBY5959278.1 TlpA family protein disulfide reductase [Membranihabitans marinus]